MVAQSLAIETQSHSLLIDNQVKLPTSIETLEASSLSKVIASDDGSSCSNDDVKDELVMNFYSTDDSYGDEIPSFSFLVLQWLKMRGWLYDRAILLAVGN